MSTGKRLAKRSILGTRVACCLQDGKFYPAVIVDVRSRSPEDLRSSVYKVRVEGERKTHEVSESELVGSGFLPVSAIRLRSGQKVYITHNNREVSASVVCHTPETDEVIVTLAGSETPSCPTEEVRKRLDEVRLLESRKSARLADQDTDFAKLADVSTDRKRPPGGPSSGRSSPASGQTGTSNIDVPGAAPIPMGSRKRRSSRCGDEDTMDECAAALVLMKLSCSPRSALLSEALVTYDISGASSSSSSGVWSWAPHSSQSPNHNAGRSATPSPPLSDPSPAPTDDGIELDDSSCYEDESAPRKRRSSTRTMFQCTWRECRELAESCSEIESHIRRIHLGLSDRRRSRSLSSLHSTSDSDSEDDHEEEFYWTEVEVTVATNVDPATVGNSLVSNRLGAVANGTIGSQAVASAPPTPVSGASGAPQPISHTTVISSPQPQAVAKPQPPKATSIITISSNPNNPHYRSSLASSLPNSQTAAASTLLTLHTESASPNARGAQPVRITSPTSPHHHSVIHRTSPSPLGSGPRTNLSTHPYLQGGGWTSSSLSRAPLSKSVLKYSGGAPPYSQVSSPPTLSHMDMARPPHEDPEYRRRLHGGGALLSSSWDSSSSYLTHSNEAVGAGGGKVRVTSSPKASPGRIGKRGGESKKCRKYYGMDQKNEWCTQCKWKKACTRFGNSS